MILIAVIVCSSSILAWTPPSDGDFRNEYAIRNTTNVTGVYAIFTNFVGDLIGSFIISSNLDMKGYSLINATHVNATILYQNGNALLDSSDEPNFNVNHSNSTGFWDLLDSPTDITSLGTIGSATSITSSAFVGPLTGNSDTCTTWSGETSQANLNVNSSNYWNDITSQSDIVLTYDMQISSVDWSTINDSTYPAACPGTGSTQSYVSTIADSTTCTSISNLDSSNIQDVYVFNSGDLVTWLSMTEYLIVETNTLYVNDSKVGIGTITPSTALDVVGNITLDCKIGPNSTHFICFNASGSIFECAGCGIVCVC